MTRRPGKHAAGEARAARPHLAGRQAVIRHILDINGDGQGTLFIVHLHRYSELAIALSARELDQLTEDLWTELDAFASERGQVFRLDSSQFGIVWSGGLSEGECILACARLLERLRHLPFCRHADLQISVQIGVASGSARSSETVERWVHRAHLALAHTEPSFPRYAIYEPDMEQQLLRRWQLRQGLARALEEQQFELVYQPRIELASGRCHGVEALLRWVHPDHGVIGPDEFVPLLEDSGVMVQITQWVLHRAARELADWLEDHPHRSFAFNVSTRALIDPEFGDALKHSLALWGLDPQQVVMEVTETAAWQQRESSIRVLNDLRQLGLRVAIDDFGTGYSTLDYLRQLPVDQIKIDRSFVSRVLDSRLDAFLVQVAIEIGREMGLTVIAEGAENDAQLVRLREMGCHSAQGYAVALPMRRDQLLAWSSTPASIEPSA